MVQRKSPPERMCQIGRLRCCALEFFVFSSLVCYNRSASSRAITTVSASLAQPSYFVASRSTPNNAMAASEQQQQPRDCVTPLKTRGEIDVVRLEAALGHKQELKRNFGLWSLTSLGVIIAKYVN